MESSDRQNWWRGHRRDYNLWLIGAGLLAFASYCGVVWSRCPEVDTYEITPFTVAFQIAGYLFAIAVANACYFLGTISEKLFSPDDPMKFRRLAFGVGVAVTVILPLLVPVLAYINVPRCH